MSGTLLEKDVQGQATDYLRLRGWTVKRRNTGAMVREHKGKKRAVRFEEPGASDLYGMLPNGIHFELEIKRPGEKPRLDQMEWLHDWHARGAVAFWVDSLDVLRKIAPLLEAGYRIDYLPARDVYRVKERGIWVSVMGPSMYFDIKKG